MRKKVEFVDELVDRQGDDPDRRLSEVEENSDELTEWRPYEASHFVDVATKGHSRRERQATEPAKGTGVVSLAERLREVADGPRLGYSDITEDTMAPQPIPADVNRDGKVDAADRELIALLKDKVRKSDAFSDDEKKLLLAQLDSGDPVKVEQAEERYEASIFLPTPADKFKRMVSR
jgi:hypothetical protein